VKKAERIDISGFTFDQLQTRLFDASGEAVELRPRSSALLAYLVSRPDQLVAKDELLDAIWPDTTVSDESVARCIADIRKVLGEGRRHHIETVPRRGYQFRSNTQSGATTRSLLNRKRYLGSGVAIGLLLCMTISAIYFWEKSKSAEGNQTLRLAVLPFDDHSVGEDAGYLKNAISEGIANELSRFKNLTIVSTMSSFKVNSDEQGLNEIGSELSADIILDGSQNKSGDRLRIAARLSDPRSGDVLFAETFERKLSEFFDVQTEVVQRVSATVGNEMTYHAPKTNGLASLGALHHYLEGKHYSSTNKRTPETMAVAERYFRKALEADADAAWGDLGLAFVYWAHMLHGWGPMSRDELQVLAESHADAAIAKDSRNHEGYFWRAQVYKETGDQESAIDMFNRALELNPSSARARMFLAASLLFKGDGPSAVREAKESMRLNPLYDNNANWTRAMTHYSNNECIEAKKWFERMGEIPIVAYRHYSAVLVCAGHVDLAREKIAVYIDKYPDHTIEREKRTEAQKHQLQENRDLYISRLRTAGMPEGM
jgi:TolB-like protein/DNA-binding winged helix-turn-helix (wHTH) protein